VLFAEASGIWIFARYWLLKSKELALSDGEFKAVCFNQPPSPAAPNPATNLRPAAVKS